MNLSVLSALCALTHSAAFRHDSDGWIQVHLQGTSYDIGYDYGRLLSHEIDDAQKALHDQLMRDTGKPWSYFRETSQRVYWPKVDPEYRQEMEGQAVALKEAGFPYDKWDVLAMNAYIEVSDYYLPWSQHRTVNRQACSAFIATGSETSDGKIVMGQNFWWDYQTGERFNILLDVTPAKGHRFVMDCLPGFLHSGTDFAVNDAGLILTETTLPSPKDYDPEGIPEFVRMRKAIQYGASLDEFAKIMKDGNNGGYANTWLVGDTKTGEIGKLELGLKNVTFAKTTNGYYVGSNFPENPQFIAEELPGWDASPKTNGCEARRVRWNDLLTQNKGHVDAEKAKAFLGDDVNPENGQATPGDFTICGKTDDWGSNNAKVITTGLAGTLTLWGRMGISDGTGLSFNGRQSPYLHDIHPHPWSLFTPVSK